MPCWMPGKTSRPRGGLESLQGRAGEPAQSSPEKQAGHCPTRAPWGLALWRQGAQSARMGVRRPPGALEKTPPLHRSSASSPQMPRESDQLLLTHQEA